jgi:hypothetical protein
MVVAQHSSQALTPLDDLERIARSCERSQQLISAILMISLGVDGNAQSEHGDPVINFVALILA